MPQVTPGKFRDDLRQQTTDIYLPLLTITHSQLDTTKLVSNTEKIERVDGDYLPYPFSVTLPTETDKKPPMIEIAIDIVDHRIMEALRATIGLRENPIMSIEVIKAAEVEEPVYGPADFEYLGFETDTGETRAIISAGFIMGAINDAYPTQRFSQSNIK